MGGTGQLAITNKQSAMDWLVAIGDGCLDPSVRKDDSGEWDLSTLVEMTEGLSVHAVVGSQMVADDAYAIICLMNTEQERIDLSTSVEMTRGMLEMTRGAV